jgi:hypothetical protein
MDFNDAVTLCDTRTTADGYLVADVRIARAGIQIYGGKEVGRPDMETVRVYRPEAEVFNKDAMASFAYRPVTNDHPAEAVKAENWKKHAVGNLSGDVARDGEFLRVPMIVMDAAAIADWKTGKREVSCGYTCDLKFEPGTTPSGEAYDAVQTAIRGNHLAIVRAGRAGSECRIGDETRDFKGGPMATKTVMVDGFSIETTDQGAQAIEKLQKLLSDANTAFTARDAAHKTALTTIEATVAKHVTDLAAKDAEIATLKTQLADAKITPAKLRDAAKAYAGVVAVAKALAPTLAVTDAMDEPAIRKAVVAAKLGDAAKDWTDAQIETSFATLAAGVSVTKGSDPIRDAISGGLSANDADKAVTDARAKYLADLRGEKAA